MNSGEHKHPPHRRCTRTSRSPLLVRLPAASRWPSIVRVHAAVHAERDRSRPTSPARGIFPSRFPRGQLVSRLCLSAAPSDRVGDAPAQSACSWACCPANGPTPTRSSQAAALPRHGLVEIAACPELPRDRRAGSSLFSPRCSGLCFVSLLDLAWSATVLLLLLLPLFTSLI